MKRPCLGLDFGGVIVPRARSRAELVSREAVSDVEPVDGALESIRKLTGIFGGRVWVVSKASPATEARTLEWMRAHSFCRETGIDSERVVFVRNRGDKRVVCTESGITHFVDDQLKNLALLRRVVPHLYLFGEGEDAREAARVASVVSDWGELEGVLRQSLGDLGVVASDGMHIGES